MASAAWAQQRTFDVPAQDATKAVPEFARQAGVQIVAPGEQLRGVVTQPVKGQMDARAALAAMLKGTGLAVGTDDGAVITLRKGPALPQQPAAAAPALERPQEISEIVVTGSLIKNPNLTRSSPVMVTNADAIELKQNNTAEEILREIPGIVPGVGSAYNLGNPGAAFVNLRGLGDNRNLVLIDGVRLTPAELRGRFDLNNIPLALIERVDVLTGGASTTYGADAISGVVNFVTKTNFTGVEITASEQITGEGDGEVTRIDVAAGTNFAEARGNVVVAAGYQKADEVYQADRSFSARQFDSFTGLPSGSGVAVPSSFSLPGLGTQQINSAGVLAPFSAPFNFSPYNLFQLGFERYNAYAAGRYRINDTVEAYARGVYSRNTVKSQIAPGGSFSTLVQIPLSNPYLSDALRSQFCVANGISTTACATAATITNPSDPGYRQVASVMSRRSVEAGPRIGDITTDYFDVRFGLRGALTRSIDWDVYGAYGESENVSSGVGLYRISRITQSLLAVRNPSGDIVCRNAADGCVPVNWFGPEGSITPAMSRYLSGETSTTNRVSQAQVSAKLSGDLGWSTPWAVDPVSFAGSAEYRSQEASQVGSELSRSGDLSGGNGAVPTIRGKYDVYEAAGEFVAPLVRDMPLIADLTVEAGIRYSRYKIDAATSPSFNTTTWKVGGNWSPIRDIKIRGNFAHAVRAPNIAELFSPRNTVVGFLSNDPCANLDDRGNRIAGRAIPAGALRDACIAQGAPAGQIGFIQQPTAGQANTTVGGNLDLAPEESDSWTLGAVVTPSLVPGLSLTIDYYDIKVTGAISSPTAGDAVSACFNSPSASNPACTVIRRNTLTGSLNGDQNTVGGLFLGLSNLGRLATDGLDVSVNYSRDLGAARWSASIMANWTNHARFQATPVSVDRDCVGRYELNCVSLQPEIQWSVRQTLSFDRADVSLLWRHIDSMRATDALYQGPIPGLGSGTYDFRRIPAFNYFDLSGRLRATERVTLNLTIQNLFDKKPPLVGGTVGAGGFNSGNTFPSTYDTLGRRFALSAKVTL